MPTFYENLESADLTQFGDAALEQVNQQLMREKDRIRAVMIRVNQEVSRRQVLERQAQALKEMSPEVRELVGPVPDEVLERMAKWADFGTAPDAVPVPSRAVEPEPPARGWRRLLGR